MALNRTDTGHLLNYFRWPNQTWSFARNYLERQDSIRSQEFAMSSSRFPQSKAE